MAILDVLAFIGKFFFSFFTAFIRLFVPPAPKSIRGKLVLVTGAAQGIGRALASEFARHGANLVLWDINQEGCEEAAKDIREATGVQVKPYACDISNYNEVKDTAAQVRRDMGDVDILVNNAGTAFWGPTLDMSEKDVKKLIDVNVVAHFLTVMEFLPAMLNKKEGHIVAMASMSAFLPASMCVGYVATKHAVRGFCDALRNELDVYYEAKDIHISVVCPAFVNTPLSRDLVDKITVTVKDEDIMSPEYVAKEIVSRVLRNEKLIGIPSALIRGIHFCQGAMPKQAQDLLQKALFGSCKPRKSE